MEISTFSWFFLVGRLNVTMANHASVTLMGFSAAVVSGFDLGCMDVFLERASARARARADPSRFCVPTTAVDALALFFRGARWALSGRSGCVCLFASPRLLQGAHVSVRLLACLEFRSARVFSTR